MPLWLHALAASAQTGETSESAWRLQDHLRFRGHVDTYLAIDPSDPADQRRPGFLYSHARANGVNVNLALVGAELDTRDVRAAAILMAGTFTTDNQGFEEPGLQNVYQARVGVRLAGRTWIDAGVFPSHLGAESAISTDNPTLTRSLTAENSPYYLAGVKIGTDVGDALSLGAVVANGWQSIRQTDPLGGGAGTWVTWRPADGLTVNWSTWVGLQQPAGEVRAFNDVYAVLSLDRVDLIGWADVGTQAGAVWGGGNLQARGWLTRSVGISARAESFVDPDGVIVALGDGGGALFGGSVGLDVARRELLPDGAGVGMWRIEARSLRADREAFDGSPWSHAVTTSLAVGL